MFEVSVIHYCQIKPFKLKSFQFANFSKNKLVIVLGKFHCYIWPGFLVRTPTNLLCKKLGSNCSTGLLGRAIELRCSEDE